MRRLCRRQLAAHMFPNPRAFAAQPSLYCSTLQILLYNALIKLRSQCGKFCELEGFWRLAESLVAIAQNQLEASRKID